MQKPELKVIELMAKFNNNKEYVMILVEECISASQHEAYIPFKVPPIETKEFWKKVKLLIEKSEENEK